MARSTTSAASTASVAIALVPAMAAVLAGFLIIGAALPVLPLHVHRDLGFGTFIVGLVAGAQFAASLVSRFWVGSFADAHGGKQGVVLGLITASAAGLLYLLSLAVENSPRASIVILLLGRVVLGAAESFIITSGVSWGLALVDPKRAGQVIAWVGMAMFAALALGGPLGTVLFATHGFMAIALLTGTLPLIVVPCLLRAPAAPRRVAPSKIAFRTVIGAVWLPGLGAALSSIGYGAVLAFSSLLYAQHGWQPVWLAFTAFGTALIVARLLFGHLPDKFGGARTALVFGLLQATGLIVMGLAETALVASAGAALAGFGYSLVFPGLGLEAVKAAPDNRGMVMGLYTACLDVALTIGSPTLGWIAGQSSTNMVFTVSAGVTLGAVGIVTIMLRRRCAL